MALLKLLLVLVIVSTPTVLGNDNTDHLSDQEGSTPDDIQIEDIQDDIAAFNLTLCRRADHLCNATIGDEAERTDCNCDGTTLIIDENTTMVEFYGAAGALVNKKIIDQKINMQVALTNVQTLKITTEIINCKKDLNETMANAINKTTENCSISVLFRQDDDSRLTAWEVPSPILAGINSTTVTKDSTTRTICRTDESNCNPTMSIDVNTHTNHELVGYKVTIKVVDIHLLNSNGTYALINTIVTPTSSAIYAFEFPKNDDKEMSYFLDITTSNDIPICSTVSIQDKTDLQCPFLDTEETIKFRGTHFTMLKKSFMNISKETFPNGAYIVILPKAKDDGCYLKTPDNNRAGNMSIPREANIKIHIEVSKSKKIYKSMAIIIALYAGLAVLAFIFTFSFKKYTSNLHKYQTRVSTKMETESTFQRNETPMEEDEDQKNQYEKQKLKEEDKNDGVVEKNYNTPYNRQLTNVSHEPFLFRWQEKTSFQCAKSEETRPLSTKDGKLDCSSIMVEGDMKSGAMLAQVSTILSLKEDCVDTEDILGEKRLVFKWNAEISLRSHMFAWITLLTGSFYVIPVMQYVYTLQKSMMKTGDMDICYFNNYCLFWLGGMYDFSHVFSNVGYLLSGIGFICIVKYRSYQYEQLCKRSKDTINRGIPEQHGIFYALGLCLIFEAILSSAYHICPNEINFQFDTTFMYIMSFLIFLKVYQFRHPDAVMKAYTVFVILAIILVIEVFSIVTEGYALFKIMFIILYMAFLITFQLQIYYGGHDTFNKTWKALNNIQKNYKKTTWKYTHKKIKALLCMFVLIINIILAMAYLVIPKLYNLSSYMLAILMFNLFIYVSFYLFSKAYYRFRVKNWLIGESFNTMSSIYGITAAALAGLAMKFFLNKLKSSHGYTPAESRNLNDVCKFLVFDDHDVWHLLSAGGLFYTLMFLLTLEDSNIPIKREYIPVF